MKRFLKILILFISIFLIFLSGMITQKKYGLGNILKALNPAYVSPENISVIKKKQEGKLSIFILAGQSNMEGHGPMDNYKPIDTKGKVYAFDKNFKWKVGKDPLIDAGGVGPGVSFASEIVNNYPEKVIGLVNVAVGSTNIHQWEKSFDENSLYQKMLERALAASLQGEIKGLLFFQGANDSEGKNTDHFDDWDIQFEQFVRDVRHDLRNDSLPVIFAQIGKGNGINWEKVKECQEKVHLNNVYMIKTDDLNYQPTNEPHFTTESYIEIGKRFAATYMNNVLTSLNEK